MINNIVDQLKRDEGFSLTAYPDPLTKGEPYTIGYGHTGGVKEGDCITQKQADDFLISDINKCKTALFNQLSWCKNLDDARLGVLINMSFNIGVNGLLQFKQTLKAVKDGKYAFASAFMLDSKWARQVPKRAQRLAKQMKDGVWV